MWTQIRVKCAHPHRWQAVLARCRFPSTNKRIPLADPPTRRCQSSLNWTTGCRLAEGVARWGCQARICLVPESFDAVGRDWPVTPASRQVALQALQALVSGRQIAPGAPARGPTT